MQFTSAQFDIYRIIAPLFAGVLVILLALTRSRSLRANPSSNVLSLYILATIGYLIANTLEISSATPADNLFWSRVIYFFIPFIPTLWLGFTLRIVRDGKPLETSLLVFLLIVPVVTLAIVFSDSWMVLVWSSIEYVNQGKFIISIRTHGPWFIFYAAYTYIVSFTGLAIAVRAFMLRRSYFRKRFILLLVGVSIPIAASLLFTLKPIPGFVKDYTPIAYALSSFVFFLVTYRLDAFSIVPVAREQLVERMSDGILVFDASRRIADANKAALSILNTNENLIGCCLDADGGKEVFLPPEIIGAAKYGKRGVYSFKRSDGSPAHYSIEPIDLPGRRGGQGRLLVIRNETELRLALARLEDLARTDSLTGLANRRGFMESAESLISTAQRYGEPISVAMFDLDHFKNVNDEWGHAVGDSVLREFSRILQQNLRGSDKAGRIGGEEFALLLPRTGAQGAFTVCERIRTDFFRHVFSTEKDEIFKVTVSVGLVSPPSSTYTIESLLAAADTELYKAKSGGRNQTCMEDGPKRSNQSG